MINIFVGNLPYTARESELQEIFEEFGQVDRVAIIMDRETGRSRGFGFIEMPNRDEGEKAITELNDQDFGGRPLRVNEADRKPAR